MAPSKEQEAAARRQVGPQSANTPDTVVIRGSGTRSALATSIKTFNTGSYDQAWEASRKNGRSSPATTNVGKHSAASRKSKAANKENFKYIPEGAAKATWDSVLKEHEQERTAAHIKENPARMDNRGPFHDVTPAMPAEESARRKATAEFGESGNGALSTKGAVSTPIVSKTLSKKGKPKKSDKTAPATPSKSMRKSRKRKLSEAFSPVEGNQDTTNSADAIQQGKETREQRKQRIWEKKAGFTPKVKLALKHLHSLGNSEALTGFVQSVVEHLEAQEDTASILKDVRQAEDEWKAANLTQYEKLRMLCERHGFTPLGLGELDQLRWH